MSVTFRALPCTVTKERTVRKLCVRYFIRSSFFYGKSLHKFMKKHPVYGIKYNTLARFKAYARNWRLFLKEPIYGIGSIIRKFLEYLFAFLGMIYALLFERGKK